MPTEKTTVPKTAAAKAEAPARTRKAGPGLSKPMKPSPELAAIVGPGPMPRTEVVAKEHIRKHGLQDPANKQAIVADDKLRAVFGKDRATMFEMQSFSAAPNRGLIGPSPCRPGRLPAGSPPLPSGASMPDPNPSALAEVTSEVVAAYVAQNHLQPSELPNLIASVHAALGSLGKPVEPTVPPSR